MNMLTSPAATMTSLEIADVVKSRHDSVKRTIERLVEKAVIVQPPTVDVQEPDSLGRMRTAKAYTVGERDSYVVVAQLSPEFTARLVDYWQAHKNEPVRLPTTTETLIQMLTLQAEVERRQSEQGEQIATLNTQVSLITRAHTVLEKMPTDCEGIERIRKRMNKEYSLSIPVVDKIMRDSPYAPTVRVLVRNTHADGVHNSGFSKKEVSAIFRRFVDECQHSAGQLHTHPYIDGRFKLVRSDKI